MIVVNRVTKKQSIYESSGFVKFLYHNYVGRILLKLLCSHMVAKIVAWYMNGCLSRKYMYAMIKKYNIDMNLYENRNYNNYNDFFTRKLKKTDVNLENSAFISPCDSKILILKMNNDVIFNIKNSLYSGREIINDDIIDEYKNGYALIFRLDVSDYHRYCFIDSGTRGDYHYIKGTLHTVQPIAYTKYQVFHQNSREWTILKTKNFDDIIQTEIGAMLIGKICNHKNSQAYLKGEEKGYFEYGGSTIILFVKDNIVDFDQDILNNSKKLMETTVKYGEKIGRKKNI